MKISIIYNLTQEEWNQLTEQEHPITQYIDDTSDDVDLEVTMTIGGLTTKSQKSVPTKTAKQIAAEKARAEKLDKKKKDAEKAEKKLMAKLKVIFKNSANMEEVKAKVKEQKLSVKRNLLTNLNRNQTFLDETLPPRPTKFSMSKEEMKPLVLAEYKKILKAKLKKDSFPVNYWEDPLGKNILKSITTKLAGDTQFTDGDVNVVLSILCDFLDPKKNPQRGDINDECYITERDVHEYTPDWAKHVLATELSHL